MGESHGRARVSTATVKHGLVMASIGVAALSVSSCLSPDEVNAPPTPPLTAGPFPFETELVPVVRSAETPFFYDRGPLPTFPPGMSSHPTSRSLSWSPPTVPPEDRMLPGTYRAPTSEPIPGPTERTGYPGPPFLPILGLEASALIADLERAGMECVEARGEGSASVYCTKDDEAESWYAHIEGDSETHVFQVLSGVDTFPAGNRPSDAAVELLAAIASQEYEGASPETASAWVRRAIGRDVDTIIGGVRFRVRGDQNSIELSLRSRTWR